jgi:hypothetical protein
VVGLEVDDGRLAVFVERQIEHPLDQHTVAAAR